MNTEAIEKLYQAHLHEGSAIAYHLPVIRDLASQCTHCSEFGVKRASSSTALLLGCGSVRSYDIVDTRQARQLKKLAGDSWDYRLQDSRTAQPVGGDLLLIDSLHTYDQCRVELKRHGMSVAKYLVFHDTITFGVVGADGESGRHDARLQGIRLAIDEFQTVNPSWRIFAHYPESHGLLVLERTP